MNSRRLIIAGALVAALAGPGLVWPAPGGNVDEMRQWLGQRNQERAKLGLPGADITAKKHFAAARPSPPAGQKPPAENAPPVEGALRQGTPVLHIGRGPDGRIHHRLIIREEGPDQLQVYTPSGYAAPPADDAARLGRLTPRGRQVWMAGASLRVPASRRLKPDARPKPEEAAR